MPALFEQLGHEHQYLGSALDGLTITSHGLGHGSPESEPFEDRLRVLLTQSKKLLAVVPVRCFAQQVQHGVGGFGMRIEPLGAPVLEPPSKQIHCCSIALN